MSKRNTRCNTVFSIPPTERQNEETTNNQRSPHLKIFTAFHAVVYARAPAVGNRKASCLALGAHLQPDSSDLAQRWKQKHVDDEKTTKDTADLCQSFRSMVPGGFRGFPDLHVEVPRPTGLVREQITSLPLPHPSRL